MAKFRYWKLTPEEMEKVEHDEDKVLNWDIKCSKEPEEDARVVLPAVPIEASNAYCVAVYVLSTSNEIKATNATVANAAAISSNITAMANKNSDFPLHAKIVNNKLVVAIKIPAKNIALITPDLITKSPPNNVKTIVVIHPKVFE